MTIDYMRLASALTMQRAHLKVLLEHPERDAENFHLALAGVLRSMLCDSDWPTLITLARELSVSLRVWGPFPLEAAQLRPPAFTFNALTVSTEPEFGAYEMTMEKYLDAPIGAISLLHLGDVKGHASWYTPRQIIKWAANKEGPTHFDPKSSAIFKAIGSSMVAMGSLTVISQSGKTAILENDNFTIRIALIQIAQAAVYLADQVLSKSREDSV